MSRRLAIKWHAFDHPSDTERNDPASAGPGPGAPGGEGRFRREELLPVSFVPPIGDWGGEEDV